MEGFTIHWPKDKAIDKKGCLAHWKATYDIDVIMGTDDWMHVQWDGSKHQSADADYVHTAAVAEYWSDGTDSVDDAQYIPQIDGEDDAALVH
jgi:hypothetical protein